MDYQDISNPDNLTFDRDITPEESSRYITDEIVFALFAMVGLCADVAIIYTIFRFNRMRTVANIFLANWAIADVCSLLVTPSSYRIISVVDNFSLPGEFLCALFETGAILHVTVMWFVLLATIDWLIAAYFSRASGKFRSFYKCILATVWIIALLSGTISTSLCINEIYYAIPEFCLLCTYGAILLIVIALQCSRAVQKFRKSPLDCPTQMLTLATAFVVSYALAFVNLLFLGRYHPLLVILSSIAVFSSSVVNFTLLYLFNKDFQACFQQAIRCTRSRYEESVTEFDFPTHNSGGDNYSVQVSFHKPTEELLSNAY